MSKDSIKQAVYEALLEHSPQNMEGAQSLPSNLMEVVDSFGFFQVFMSVEQKLGINADLDGIEIGNIVELDHLVSFLEGQSQ